jgi:hypothetical protein
MSSLSPEDRIKIEELIYELRGWASVNKAAPSSDCMTEAAYALAKLVTNRAVREPEPVSPKSVLQTAQEMIDERGKRRDNGQERSMQRIVNVFHALTDHKMTEVEGWLFMVVLKLCRERTGSDLDNWIDGAAYMGLAAEAVERAKARSA